jgi:MFS family permease
LSLVVSNPFDEGAPSEIHASRSESQGSEADPRPKAARLGAPPVVAPLLWLALHLVKASTATTGGRLADRHGKRNALAMGWTVYAVTWSAVGFAHTIELLFALAVVYGTSHGLIEGAEKALIAELAGGSARGKAFGAYNMLIGLTALAASATFGVLWDTLGAEVAFVGSGAFALLAAGVLLLALPGRRARAAQQARPRDA